MRLLLPVLAVGCVPVLESPGGADDTPWAAPENTWPVSAPPEELEEEGFGVGEVVPDFLLPDQHGDDVSLWQFYGSIIVVDVSTMWCRPCQELAAGTQHTADEFRDDGVVYLTILAQDMGGAAPDQDELNEWADYFDILEPIVSDTALWSDAVLPQQDFPGVFLVDREMRMIGRVNPGTEEQLIEDLEALVAE